MRNLIVYLTLILCLFVSKIVAQENTFEARANAIALKIETITQNEKDGLKKEIEQVNSQVEKGTITQQQATDKKQQLAEVRAKNIEIKVASLQDELRNLVQEKVDGKLAASNKKTKFSFKISNDTIEKSEKRTTSQFVFALGFNNLATNERVAGSDFRYLGSHFYEMGTTFNTRILKNNNLLHLKYGYAVMYNNLRPTEDRIFVKSGDQTVLQTSSIDLKDSRFKNVYLVAPLHLEFDFSKTKLKEDGTPLFKSHQSVRLGLGGYAGVRIKSKQFQKFEDSDDNDVTVKQKGDFNANNFIYGVSGYIGYKATSLYVKYDLNPLFENNLVKQNNISLGVRFDFN